MPRSSFGRFRENARMLGGRFSLCTGASYSLSCGLGVSTRPPELLRSPRPRPTACCEESGWGFDSSPPLPPLRPRTPGELTFRPFATPERYSTRDRALNHPLPSRRVRWAVSGWQKSLPFPKSTWTLETVPPGMAGDREESSAQTAHFSSLALSPVTGRLRSALSQPCPFPPEA